MTLEHGVPVVGMKIDPQYASRDLLQRHRAAAAEDRPAGHGRRARSRLARAAGPPAQRGDAQRREHAAHGQLRRDPGPARLRHPRRADGAGLQRRPGADRTAADSSSANVFRDFDPLSRDVETASHLLSLRNAELRTLTGNLAKIATELGDNENAAHRVRARQRGRLARLRPAGPEPASRRSRCCPGALQSANTALVHATTLGHTLRSTFSRARAQRAGARADPV